jgi:signal transduction histidine kinase
VSKLKVQEVSAWLDERYGDATVQSTGMLPEEIALWVEHGKPAGKHHDYILGRLQALIAAYNYASIVAFDHAGQVLVSSGEPYQDDHLRALLQQAQTDDRPTLVNFHAHGTDYQNIRLGLIQPFRVNGKPYGTLLFQIDPDRQLYPMIKSWPGREYTAESLLFQRNGDGVLFLNKLLHAPNLPLTFRLANDPRICSTRAIHGARGFLDQCLDYRKIPVIAYAAEIPGTPWMMMTKVDLSEAFGDIHTLAATAGIIMLLAIFSLAGFMYFWRQQVLDRQHAFELKIQLDRERTEKLLAESLELKQAKEAAEQANRAKSTFLAKMTHELRTPLHAIISFGKLGVEKTQAMGEEQAKLLQFFDRIVTSGDRLLSLLDDLLDLSRLEAGKMTFNLRPHMLKHLCHEALAEISVIAENKKITFDTAQLQNDLKLECDADRIIQVLNNLLSNAIKFSPAYSTVTLSSKYITLPAASADNQTPCPGVAVTVSDEGIGIPPDELELIFDKFVQSSKNRTGAGGTGLGLSICREIVEHHGGRIYASNNPEGGTCLTFELPIHVSEHLQ